ncbi:tetratricopeptide repeat protein [Streptomyces sp. NPDC002073]
MEMESQQPPVTFSARRTAMTAAVAVVLIAGALVIRPAQQHGDDPRPPRPEQRAMASVGMGAPAAAVDVNALIADRARWVKGHPADDGAWAVLGAAYLEQARRTADAGHYPQAEAALKRSLALRPAEKGNFDAMVGMGALANARHDFVTARKWGELVRAQAPRNWTAYPVLIDAYSGLGAYKPAEAAMEKLVALRGGLPGFLRASQVYRDRGWREDAAAALERAAGAARTPAEKAYCLYRIGELAWERGEAEDALRSYEGALRTDPTQGLALGGRARALAALNRTGEAVRDYRAALEEMPAPQLALELGELLEAAGQEEDAQEAYGVLRAQVARAGTYGVQEDLVLSRYEADHADPLAAVRRLRAQWSRHKSVQVADALGWALFRSGEPREALWYARKATDLGMRNAEFAYHRGVVERDLGDTAAARRHLQEALRTNPHFSPLLAPKAKLALAALAEPAAGGPENMQPDEPWVAPVMPKPAPRPAQKRPAAGAGAGPEAATGAGAGAEAAARAERASGAGLDSAVPADPKPGGRARPWAKPELAAGAVRGPARASAAPLRRPTPTRHRSHTP